MASEGERPGYQSCVDKVLFKPTRSEEIRSTVIEMTAKGVIRFAKGTSGGVELYCTCVPREEDVPADSKLALVLHVKAQCCEYVAEKLKKNASLRIVGKYGVPYDPNNWEREAQRLRHKFYETARIAL